ncbi:hypothetical protein AOPFMNJM_3719 [Methylobacterium jeotgali]|uniref:Uncharacterized protein n=1 Tax=Methylobacterium jeotgali TaxID=381630 RepID=A0ABQ4SZ66_9HYPH|nr:hypothetical protein AOPFMNJM_3719 [Methylobacterium jeotgali]
MRVRQVALGDALAGTGAEPASGAERFARPELLEAVAGVAVEEAADALADMVQERIGHEDPEEAAGAEARHPEPVQPGHEEQRAPDDGDEHRLPEIGLKDERHDGDGQEQHRQEAAGHVAALRALREGPGRHHHEGRLHELRGLEAEGAELDPAVGALDLGAELAGEYAERHPDEPGAERQPAHLPQGQERDGDDEQDGRREVERLPVEEVEGRQADALGHRRAAAHQEDEAGHHQRPEPREQAAVDGPPPVGQRRAIRAGHHGQGASGRKTPAAGPRSCAGMVNGWWTRAPTIGSRDRPVPAKQF